MIKGGWPLSRGLSHITLKNLENLATQIFCLLNKYRPETKAEKKGRLVKEAEVIEGGKKKGGKTTRQKNQRAPRLKSNTENRSIKPQSRVTTTKRNQHDGPRP